MKISACRPLILSAAFQARPRIFGTQLALSERTSQQSRQRTTVLRMAPALIDVDCNLWHRDLKSLQSKEIGDDECWNILDEDAIEEANIVAMISPSSTIDEAKRGLDLLSRTSPPLPIKTTVGVHPYHVNDEGIKGISLEKHREEMSDLIKSSPNLCGAVGECGLDASEGFPPLEDQIPLFRLQVEIANELNLPLFVHERLAFEQTMDILDSAKVPIIIHCFTGTKEQCTAYVEKGYYLSVSGYILKSSNDNYDEVISCLEDRIIPLDKLMIETDAPYMGFTGCRQLYLEHNESFVSSLNSKKRKRLQQSIYPNVPSSLPAVLEKVVECYRSKEPTLAAEEIAEATTRNAKRFFGLET
jgi:TatD DNase family protein